VGGLSRRLAQVAVAHFRSDAPSARLTAPDIRGRRSGGARTGCWSGWIDGQGGRMTDAACDAARWISVGELHEAFTPGSYAPAFTDRLGGKRLTLFQEDGGRVEYEFLSHRELRWTTSNGAEGTASGDKPRTVAYSAIEPREGLFLVDYLPGDALESVDVVLDLNRGIGTTLVGRLPDPAEAELPLSARAATGLELTGVAATFISSRIDAPFAADTPRHEPPLELVGRRVEYTYSPHERYEHIYLNERFYTWHCLAGREKGLADTDRCHYLRVDDDMYLFVWREKIVPTLGVVLLDYQRMRSAGKICGLRGPGSKEPANFPVGAQARIVNVTTY